MPDYRGFLSNCLIGGVDMTPLPNGGRVRNLICLTLDDSCVEIHQHPDVIRDRENLLGQFLESTDVLIRDVPQHKKDKADQIMEELADLLSLATLSPVAFYGYEYPDNSGQIRQFSVIGTAQCRWPTLQIRHGPSVQNFLHQVWPNYRRIKKNRRLNIPINLLVQAGASPKPVELLLLIVFVTLENLKSTYASEKRIPFVNGFFRKITAPTVNLKKAPKYSFEDLLTLMFKEVGIQKELKRIVRLRNDIIHSAVSESPADSQWKTFQQCHDLTKRYMLRLLGYRGEYWSASAGVMRMV